MWRTVTVDRPGASGASATAAPGEALTSAFHTQESPLLGLLSAVSRPAVSFLQRYLPGRDPAKRNLKEQDSEFLRQFDDIQPPQQLHSLPWFNLAELGLQSPEDTSLSSRTVVSHVLVSGPRSVSKTWWGSLWGTDEEDMARSLSAGLQCAENRRTALFVQERGENAGASRDKGAFTINRSVPQLKIIQSLGLGSDIAVLTPDQDNGYSSLEEEQLLVAKAQLQGALLGMVASAAQQQASEECLQGEDIPVLKCDNKAIAFIMGCPCSDDSQSESEEDSEDEDDDGFDSDCSSDVSDSDDEDEFNSETERLWSTLCQNHDPYNPRNFTAKIGSAPKPIPKLEPNEVQSSPGSSVSSSCGSSSSWDEASETDEQENLILLGSFCSTDPYSPLNFQAPIRTKNPEPRPVEEQGQGFSEPSSSEQTSARPTSRKKVRFCDEVQLFLLGSEDRSGPWEQFARDRARFQRRCSEIEQQIGFCLQMGHRDRIYHRVCASNGQSEAEQGQAGQSEEAYEEEITL